MTPRYAIQAAAPASQMADALLPTWNAPYAFGADDSFGKRNSGASHVGDESC